uniref:Uncharacterized protein n=1 Tax=Human herpesvirus 1 TaxID=10298 RepID=A0A2Z4HFF4_HHV1|nr:hypothetical protein [Human alphaherpesvirus 1]
MPLELTSTVGRGRDRTRIPRLGFPLPSPVRIHNKHEHIHYKTCGCRLIIWWWGKELARRRDRATNPLGSGLPACVLAASAGLSCRFETTDG